MKYYAEFTANNGSTYMANPIEDTNKAKLIRSIKYMVRGNHYQQPCNQSTYRVWDEKGKVVASGYVFGKNAWRVREEEIGMNVRSL